MRQVDVLICGGGQAGAQVAISLRRDGFAGTIAIVCDEPHLPYERPPLSKAFLLGEVDGDRLILRQENYWVERQIQVLLNLRVEQVLSGPHTVRLINGESIQYGKLVWAAGGRPRMLACPGAGLAGVHVVRTLAQAEKLRREAEQMSSVVIIGGGYIGLETAAVFARQGKRVTVLEAMQRLLARVTSETISQFYLDEHASRGVDVRLNSSVEALEGTDRVTAVRLANGETIAAELVVVGIGLLPNVEPLVLAGAETSNGIDIDELCRTTLPDVFGIGDCANQVTRFAGNARVRLESVQSAVDQANHVAKVLMGSEEPFEAVPWFWSNQYDVRLQTVGLFGGHDFTVVRGDPASRSFSVVYLSDSKVIAIDCINRLQDFTQGKKLVAAATSVNPELIKDPCTPLRQLVD